MGQALEASLGIGAPLLALVGMLAVGGLLHVIYRREHDLQARYGADLAAEASRQRTRIEGELHDGAQQLVVALGRELRGLRKILASNEALSRLNRAEELATQLGAELLRVRSDLMPPALRLEGLTGALPPLVAGLGQRHGYATACEIGDWPRLAPELEEALYWLVQEAMNNAATHSQATRVAVRLVVEGERGLIEVADDGRGCAPRDLSVAPTGVTGTGLHRLWLRLHAAGGELALDTPPGGGCRLRARLPLPPAPARST